MLEQIKKDACYLFEVKRSDKDGVKYAMTMYLLLTTVITLITGVYGLVTLLVVEWIRAKKKPTSTPTSEQPTSQSQTNRKA